MMEEILGKEEERESVFWWGEKWQHNNNNSENKQQHKREGGVRVNEATAAISKSIRKRSTLAPRSWGLGSILLCQSPCVRLRTLQTTAATTRRRRKREWSVNERERKERITNDSYEGVIEFGEVKFPGT